MTEATEEVLETGPKSGQFVLEVQTKSEGTHTTTRLTFFPCAPTDFKMLVVPSTAGLTSSSGSVALKWNGEAVCKTPSTSWTALSNAPASPTSSTMIYSNGLPSKSFLT